MLRVIEHNKAAVEESSTKCAREGPAWQTGSFSALSCVAVGPNDCFALLQLCQAGWAACFSRPAPFPYGNGSVLSPQCFHLFGFDLYLLSWNCPSTDLLSVAVFPCLPGFLNVLLVSLRNIILGEKLSLVDLKGQWVFGLFTPPSAGSRACQKVMYTLCASSD